MSGRTALAPAEVERALAELRAWKLVAGKLHREITFKDFAAAFGFMAQVALIAERMDHHPDWSNAWNKVRIDLITHSAGALTARDVELARAIDRVAPA